MKKIDKTKLPWYYRLVLKIPGTSFLEDASGVFWNILVPIFMIFEFFLSMFLLLMFPFPANIVLTAIIPTAVFLAFIRITLERFINWWNLTIGKSSFEWNIEKTMQEYIASLKKKEQRKE